MLERVSDKSPERPLTPNSGQGGFIQENKNVKTLVLSHQPPSNEFGANSKSLLK
jgi:hypothetical protein